MFLITVFTAVFTAALFLAATAAAAALVVTVLSLEVDPAQLSEQSDCDPDSAGCRNQFE